MDDKATQISEGRVPHVESASDGTTARQPHPRVPTGIAGLDHILRGGLPSHRLFVIEGDPGAGKTTLALQFLMEGARRGERGLYITLSETAHELHEVAASHGWSLDGIDLLELDTLAERLNEDANYTIYHPADVELGETIKHICSEVERLQPALVALDSVSELKILSETNARYRREILALKQFFAGQKCTTLILDDRTTREEQQLQSIAHGVIRMERQLREYGNTRRQIHVVKMRGVRFRDGFHDFTIDTGGITVYPLLSAIEHSKDIRQEVIQSGVRELDQLLGSGLNSGSSVLVMGPAGSGKSTVCTQFLIAALARGEAASCLIFEESRDTFCGRAAGLGLPMDSYVSSGLLEITQMDPAVLSPGEFAAQVRHAVEERHVSMVIIDSINGYMNAMPSERFLLLQMHELLTYLNQQGVVTLLVLAQQGMLGQGMQVPVDVSFLADTMILLRFFETQGEVRQAISVVKKRRGAHERTIRELRLGPGGVRIGEPLREFEGVLTGIPRYRGKAAPLLTKEDAE